MVATVEVERYSDRFQASSGMEDGTAIPLLESTHLQRNYDRSLLPNAVFEAVFERKTKSKGGESESIRSQIMSSS